MQHLIPRNLYLEQVTPFIDKNIIKVFTGQRRVGKSCILRQLMTALENPESQIIYVDMEDFAYRHIKNDEDLTRHIDAQIAPGKKNYVFIDEIQEIKDFENSLRHLHGKDAVDIYCTGSNATMFSGELATRLSGRFMEFRIWGLAYTEFLEFNGLKNTSESLYLYLRYGTMPFVKHLAMEDEIIYAYLKNIYNTIILKDVVKHFGIRNISFLERLIEFIAEHCGSLISAKKISDFLKSQKINISTNRVLDYLSHLESAFFINRVKRRNIEGKKVFEIGEKYYFEDIGLRNALVGYKQADISKILENCIFHHLKVHGYTVYVGNMSDREIDFVAEKTDKTLYVQVVYTLADSAVIEREFGNLGLIRDNHPKLVISMDEGAGGNIDGIHHVHVRDFIAASPDRFFP